MQVYVNGIMMDDADHNTSALGNAIYLTSAANLNDIITVVACRRIFRIATMCRSAVVRLAATNFSGDLTVGATAIR